MERRFTLRSIPRRPPPIKETIHDPKIMWVNASSESVRALHVNWGWMLLRAALLILFGIAALLVPMAAVLAMTFLFGAYALVDGVLSIIIGIKNFRRKEHQWWTFLLRGAVGIFAAAIVIFLPLAATVGMVVINWILLALWALFAGAMEFLAGLRLRKESGKVGWLLILSGVVSLLLGLAIPVLLGLNPGAGVIVMGWMIGTYAFASGILLAVLAFRLRKLARETF